MGWGEKGGGFWPERREGRLAADGVGSSSQSSISLSSLRYLRPQGHFLECFLQPPPRKREHRHDNGRMLTPFGPSESHRPLQYLRIAARSPRPHLHPPGAEGAPLSPEGRRRFAPDRWTDPSSPVQEAPWRAHGLQAEGSGSQWQTRGAESGESGETRRGGQGSGLGHPTARGARAGRASGGPRPWGQLCGGPWS